MKHFLHNQRNTGTRLQAKTPNATAKHSSEGERFTPGNVELLHVLAKPGSDRIVSRLAELLPGFLAWRKYN
jgi:hypothetical protein